MLILMTSKEKDQVKEPKITHKLGVDAEKWLSGMKNKLGACPTISPAGSLMWLYLTGHTT